MQRHPRTTEKGYDYGERQKKITFTRPLQISNGTVFEQI